MNTNEELLARYEALAVLMAQMHDAANGDNWNVVISLQDQYKQLVDGLKHDHGLPALNERQRARKHDLLRQILSDDAIIRDLASPRLARLSALLSSNRNTRALQEMYGLKPR